MKAVVLADDLSGAAELGALALTYGLTAEVQTDFDPSTSADVCLIDTDTRSFPAELAVRRVAQVARRILALPPLFVYKKVDSLLRGQVLAEVRAAARTLGRPRVLLIPANPSRGRVIREGRYFVAQTPLDATSFAHDPEHPRRTSDVRALLEQADASALPSSLETGLGEVHVATPDVTTARDVEGWASKIGPDTLPAGAADFFAALLARQAWVAAHGERIETPATAPRPAAQRTLLVCGSAASWEDRRSAALASGLDVLSAPASVFAAQRDENALAAWAEDIAAALARSRTVCVGLGLSGAGADASITNASAPAGALARRLADAVARALRRTHVDQVLLEGGATAAAVVRALGWNRLSVTGAPGPGVAELRPLNMPHGTTASILVKPGSYPWPASVWDSIAAHPSN